jgi:hypothetical protein
LIYDAGPDPSPGLRMMTLSLSDDFHCSRVVSIDAIRLVRQILVLVSMIRFVNQTRHPVGGILDFRFWILDSKSTRLYLFEQSQDNPKSKI